MHTGMVAYEGTKMSKSLGNLVFVRDLLKSWDPGAIRLAILANHYRSDWEWQDDLLVQGLRRLTSWRAGYQGAGSAGRGPGHPHPAAALAGGPEATPIGVSVPKPGQLHGRNLLDEVREALDDDLATPRALAAIDRVAGAATGLSRVTRCTAASPTPRPCSAWPCRPACPTIPSCP